MAAKLYLTFAPNSRRCAPATASVLQVRAAPALAWRHSASRFILHSMLDRSWRAAVGFSLVRLVL